MPQRHAQERHFWRTSCPPPLGKGGISRSEGEGGCESSENWRSTPQSCPNRVFVFAVDAVQERASVAPTATFVALDLPIPPAVEVAKFWGVVWCLCVMGRADRALDRVQNCGLFACNERMEQEKKNCHSLVIEIPRLPLPFPPIQKWCSGTCLSGKSRRGRVKREGEVRKGSRSRLLAYHRCIKLKKRAKRS